MILHSTTSTLTKKSYFEVSDDVIACYLWFGPPSNQNPGYVYDINCRLILILLRKINELTFNFNLRYFCFSVNYLTLTKLKKCLKILSELIRNEDNNFH